MNLKDRVYRAAYAALGPAAFTASQLLPARANSGLRARRALKRLKALHSFAASSFQRSFLLSNWRSALLLQYMAGLSQRELIAFVQEHVSKEGIPPWELSGSGARPVIIVTPHYGACIAGCVALSYWLRDVRPLAIYYELRRQNAGIESLLRRAGNRVATLDAGVAGAVRALKVLLQGGCVALMPDMYLDVTATVAVPFLGCWLRVPTGAAHLALRSDALIVPAYAVALPAMRIGVRFGGYIDPRSVRSGDDVQDRFMLTCIIFADIERTLRRSPEHWLQWECLPRISTPLELPESFSSDDVRSALAARCRLFPPLGRYFPELVSRREAQTRG